ncbi:MAG TPA: YdeI/OmpD-associated family protein [Anaerolinea sp.]|nr:YdeI/OmpD-associated family protein [Anaerolinea sp.]
MKSGLGVRINLPFDPDQVWGVKERHHVSGRVNQVPVRGSVAKDEQGYFLRLGAAWLRDSGLAAGAEVEVTLSPEGPQVETLPADVAAALQAEPRAAEFFAGLPTFYRKNFMRWIEGAKRAETRKARIAEMIDLLRSGKRQR